MVSARASLLRGGPHARGPYARTCASPRRLRTSWPPRSPRSPPQPSPSSPPPSCLYPHRRCVLRGRHRRVHRRPVLRLRGPRPQVLVLLAVVLSFLGMSSCPSTPYPSTTGRRRQQRGGARRARIVRALGGGSGACPLPRALDGERGTRSCAQGTHHGSAGARAGARGKARGPRMRAEMCASEDVRGGCARASMQAREHAEHTAGACG